MIFFDSDNMIVYPDGFNTGTDAPFDDRCTLQKFVHARLLVAAELTRCGGYRSIDAALDDADTALGILNRSGYINFEDLP